MFMPKHFMPQELLPQSWIDAHGDNAMLVMDDRILKTLDNLSMFFKLPIIVNDYCRGGILSYRGYRPTSYTACSDSSQHRFGRAVDFDVKGKSAEQVRQIILKNRYKFPFITRMESDVSWVHIDCANTGKSEMVLFNK
jgi:hypothetical protein